MMLVSQSIHISVLPVQVPARAPVDRGELSSLAEHIVVSISAATDGGTEAKSIYRREVLREDGHCVEAILIDIKTVCETR
jgi:hypothetical protein